MSYQFIKQDVKPKWNYYKKFINPIFKSAFLETKDKRKDYSASIILVNDEEMKSLNNQYRSINHPTDVLTFISDDEDDYLGDIFINVDALERQAIEYQHTKKREFCFLVCHGILHLLGYDHQTKEDEVEMFNLQEEILKDIAPRYEKI